MRSLMLLLTLGLVVALAEAQNSQSGGLFSTLTNWFRPRRQSDFNNGNSNSNNRPPQRFNSNNNFQPNNNNFNNGNQAVRQQGTIRFATNNNNNGASNFRRPNNNNNNNRRPNNNSNRRPNNNSNRRPVQQQQSFAKPAPLSFRKCHTDEPKPFCPQEKPNHFFEGRDYLLTFNMNCGSCLCKNFTGEEADDYCKSMGARAISLDTPSKIQHFRDVSAQFAQRYFWTGGRLNYPDQSYTWPSGKTVQLGAGNSDPWSYTGGWDGKPQPDNRNQIRDNCEPELCIGVLNNFYADGIVWHDVACHHKKPTICEWP